MTRISAERIESLEGEVGAEYRIDLMRRHWTCCSCVRLLGIGLFLLLLFSGCSREISDRQLGDLLNRNGSLFNRVVDRGLGSDLSCHESNHKAVCNISELTNTFDELRRAAGVKAIYARHDLPELGNAVYVAL